jgi:hypothetical protein
MKKIKNFLLLVVFSLALATFSPVLAADTDATINGLNETAGKVAAYKDQAKDNTDAKTVILNRVGGLVGLVLSFVGIIFLLLIVWAGIQWMTAQGNSAQVDKAKDLMINAVIGLIIVTAAYSITYFVGNQFTTTQ